MGRRLRKTLPQKAIKSQPQESRSGPRSRCSFGWDGSKGVGERMDGKLASVHLANSRPVAQSPPKEGLFHLPSSPAFLRLHNPQLRAMRKFTLFLQSLRGVSSHQTPGSPLMHPFPPGARHREYEGEGHSLSPREHFRGAYVPRMLWSEFSKEFQVPQPLPRCLPVSSTGKLPVLTSS